MTQDNLSTKQRGASTQRPGRSVSTYAGTSEPPTKKRRLTEDPKSLARNDSLVDFIASTGQNHSPLATETIDVDASDEEDPISMFPSDDTQPVARMEATPTRKNPFQEPGVASTIGVPNSPGIKAVLNVVGAAKYHSAKSFWEGKAGGATGAGETSTATGPSKYPHVDFRNTSKKSGMKKRNGETEDRTLTAAGKQQTKTGGSSQRVGQSASTNQAGPSSATQPISSTMASRKTSSVPAHQLGKAPAKSDELRGLPLKLWYCGGERRNQGDGSTLWAENDCLVIKNSNVQVVERIHHKSIISVEVRTSDLYFWTQFYSNRYRLAKAGTLRSLYTLSLAVRTRRGWPAIILNQASSWWPLASLHPNH